MTSSQLPDQQTINNFVGLAHGDLNRVKQLLEEYPQLLTARADWDETALGAAAQMGRADIAEFLLSAGAPLDICTAAMLGRADRVAAMLQADPELSRATGAHGIPLMYYPVITAQQDVAELLLANGADVNAAEGVNTALHGAALFGQVAMARWLLDHGAQVDARDYAGKTPLAIALERDNSEMADLLRKFGGTG